MNSRPNKRFSAYHDFASKMSIFLGAIPCKYRHQQKHSCKNLNFQLYTAVSTIFWADFVWFLEHRRLNSKIKWKNSFHCSRTSKKKQNCENQRNREIYLDNFCSTKNSGKLIREAFSDTIYTILAYLYTWYRAREPIGCKWTHLPV